MTAFGVHSEVGKLRKVIVHRPDLSLKRLTPANHDDLLFDDVLWVEQAQREHDAFVEVTSLAWRRGLFTQELSPKHCPPVMKPAASSLMRWLAVTVGWSIADEIRQYL